MEIKDYKYWNVLDTEYESVIIITSTKKYLYSYKWYTFM